MPKITPIYLAEIFRTLSSSSKEVNLPPEAKGSKNARGARTTKKNASSLKSKLADTLKSVKETSDTFDEEAPLIAIQEVILWEFGEESINDPDFRQVTESITDSIMADPNLKAQMSNLINSLL